MKKFFSSLFILILAVSVFVVVAKDWIIKTAIEQGVTRVTGFSTSVASVKFDFPSTIQIQNLTIRNPEGQDFKEEIFVSIPEIYASVVLSEAIKGTRIHLPEVRLNVQTVNVEKNPKGVSNVELLSSIGGQGAAPAKDAASKPAPAEQKAPMPFLLEKLVLTLGQVSYSDRSGLLASAPLPKKMQMDLNVNQEVITDISDAKSLVNIIVAKVLNGATLGKLLNIDPQAMLGDVTGAGKELIGKSSEMVSKELAGVTSQAKDLVGSTQVTQKAGELLEGTAGKTTEVLGDAAGAAKKQVSGLLGKLKVPGTSDTAAEAPAAS